MPKWLIVFASLSVVSTFFGPLYDQIGCTGADCRSRQEKGRQFWIQVSGGLFALYGLWLAADRVKATTDDTDLKKREEHAARFIRAVEMLGSVRQQVAKVKSKTEKDEIGPDKEKFEPNVESRTGAVHALEELLREVPGKSEAVLSSLEDYVGERLRRQPTDFRPGEREEPPPFAWRSDSDGGLPPDVRHALRYLAGRRRKNRLMSLYLSDLSFREQDWSGSDFETSLLRGADFYRATLRDCVFIDADLTSANLSEAKLMGADLRDSHLSDVQFEGTDLAGAIFWKPGSDLEHECGLTPEQVLAARNWRQAVFSKGFRAALEERSQETSTERV